MERKKIAFIVEQFPSLSQTFVLNQITGLIDRGYEVDIFAERPGNDPTIHEDVKNYNLLDRTYYTAIPVNKLLRFIKGLGIILFYFYRYPIPILKSLNILKYGRKASSLNILYKAFRFFDMDPYEIVHCHFGPAGITGAILKDIGIIKGRLVTTFHGYDMSLYIKKEGKDVYKHLFRKGDLFLPISERWRNKLVKLGCDEKKIFVHRMGIDTRKFLFSARKPKCNDRVKLLTIARLVEKKGVQYSIRAVAELIKAFPGIEYNIVGDGPLRNNIADLIKKLHMDKNIKLHGWKTQEKIIQLLKDADIFLMPSVTTSDGDQEGIPVVLMEALAHGIPVVSTYHSGIPEIVEDGKSGFLVPERDTEAMTQKLRFLLEHQEMWSEMGRRGRKYVEDNYDINKLNDKLVNLYKNLIQ